MKASRLLLLALITTAPAFVACAPANDPAGAGFPPMPGPESVADIDGPGEAPAPIDMRQTVAPPPAPSAPPAQQPHLIVPGETTEEEYAARPPDPAESDEYADQDPSALTDFRTALEPYGSWEDDPQYGTVWSPDPNVVGDDFTPYVSNGSWAYDDYNSWTWVSGYDWGWAPFHYGRWAYLGNRWGWIPGRQYAGAWVNWRTGLPGYDYIGWAPMAPAWGWRRGLAFNLGFAPVNPWAFCNPHAIFSPGMGGQTVTGRVAATITPHTTGYSAPTSAGAGGRVIAHPTVGPPPTSVGIKPNEVARVPPSNRGILHAVRYARPSTAAGFGAASTVASNNGLGYVRRDEPIARAPQYSGVAPSRHYFPSHSLGNISGYGYGLEPHYGSGYSSRPMGGGVGAYGAPHAGTYYGPGHPGAAHPGGATSSAPGGGDHDDAPLHGGWSSGHSGFRGGGGHGGGGGGHGGGGHR